MTKYGNLWKLTQGRNFMANLGPSWAITESQLEVVGIEWGPSMEITKSQIEVITNDLKPSMAVSESQHEVVIK